MDQLETAGYVERVPDSSDARTRLVRMAPRGQEVVALARAVEGEVRAEWEAHLGPEVLRHLEESMARLREVTDPYGPGILPT